MGCEGSCWLLEKDCEERPKKMKGRGFEDEWWWCVGLVCGGGRRGKQGWIDLVVEENEGSVSYSYIYFMGYALDKFLFTLKVLWFGFGFPA